MVKRFKASRAQGRVAGDLCARPRRINPKQLLTRSEISSSERLEIETIPKSGTEKLVNAPTSSTDAVSVPVDSDVEAEISKLVGQNIPKRPPQIETDVERIRSSVARLTSNSIDGLEGLTAELQELQKVLSTEVQRVQGEIESALAGVKIIIETIAPWKSTPVSLAPQMSTRAFRTGPAANLDVAQSRR